jgi:hypothetical protein
VLKSVLVVEQNINTWGVTVVWPLIIDQRLVHLTPHMFPCHRSHSWISGGDHFLGKNQNVLAFGIIFEKNGGCFREKWSFMAIFEKNGGCLAIDLRPEAHTPHYTYVSLP